MKNKVTAAVELLRLADQILVISHRRPDGDTTGCAGALCRGLRQLGKTAYILENPDVTERYAPLIAPLFAPEDFVPAFVVTVDMAEEKLMTPNAERYAGKVDLVLDHHPSNPLYGKTNVLCTEAGGCAEVVYEVLCGLGVTLTEDIARCIYIGVSTDTGCFKFSNTTAHSHIVAAACLEAGIDGGEINRALFETKSHARFEMERIVFDTMQFYDQGKIAVAILRRADIARTGATADDLDSIASVTRQIEGVMIGITVIENANGTCKVSVRTTKEVNASEICKALDGGGHARAAGATLPDTVSTEQVVARVLASARTHLPEGAAPMSCVCG